MSYVVKNISLILAFLVLTLAPCALAQVKTGDTSLNLNGTAAAGYNDDYSNYAGSDHGLAFSGDATVSGSYYNPNFLSFQIHPYYDESRTNSSFQSLTSASGLSATAQIFSGSHYPGSISYSTSYNSSGNFNLPGIANFTTHGNNDVLAINWGFRLDNLPTLNLSFSNSDNAYSIYGANAKGTLHADTFSASTAYKIAGFSMNGGYQHSGSNSNTPEFLTGELAQKSDSGADSFFFSIAHTLPWNGGISAAANRLGINTEFGDITSTDKYDTKIDTLTGSLYFAPVSHLHTGVNTFYTDNLEGTLYGDLLTSGVTTPQDEGQATSHAFSATGYANYDLPVYHLNLYAFAERQQQTFAGIGFASTSYNGTASYSNKLMGGTVTATLGVMRTTEDTTHQSTLGLNATFNYQHQIDRWTVASSFSYSQGTQTLLIAYTTSGYNYTSSLGRRIGRRSYWGLYGSGARSLLTDQPGTSTSSQSYSTSFSVSRFSLSGSYANSSGNALLTATGLTATPIPLPVVNPADVVLYNGKSYSVGLGAHPFHGLTFSASFAKALSMTNSDSTISNNDNQTMNYFLTYNVRKLSFISGYSRLTQGFGVTGTPPAMLGSFYMGISRWFNFF
jgi:hypothetical protein